MATFIVLQGPDKGRTITANDPIVLIGRGSDQIPLTDQTVSRQHAELRAVDQGWTISDMNSANGTYLNGVRLTRATPLKQGDQIRVGGTLLVYTGDQTVRQYAGPNIPRDMVTLDAGDLNLDAAVLASTPSNEDSVVIAAPETAHAVRAWTVMRQLTEATATLLSPEQLLGRVLEIICEQIEVDRGVIFRSDPGTGELIPEIVRYQATHGPRPAEAAPIVTSRTILNHAIEKRSGVLSCNALSDERFVREKSVQNLGMRSVICAPILSGETLHGVIYLDCAVTRHTYGEAELKLVTAIGLQTGLALENSRLTQQQLKRERLAAAGETVAYLSHYIKNILQGMRSGAEIVQRGLDRRDFAVIGQGWKMVERNLERSYDLMLNMLAFSKDREPKIELLQVNRIIDDVVELVQRRADDNQVVLLTELDETVPPIPVDYDGLHQVVLNLVSNALEAVERRTGAVTIRTRFDARLQVVVITVSDNGPGVPPDQRERIFEAFHSTKGQRGTGLGLTVAQKIVNELGGTIALHCPPGGGAEFSVRLRVTPSRVTPSGDTIGPLR